MCFWVVYAGVAAIIFSTQYAFRDKSIPLSWLAVLSALWLPAFLAFVVYSLLVVVPALRVGRDERNSRSDDRH